MQYKITPPSKLDTTIMLPPSKSISNRALIIHAISGGSIVPKNISDCDDTEVIVSALAFMPETINIKAAGTAMRFMTAYLATVNSGEHTITGTERMLQRPIKVLVDALKYLGGDIIYEKEDGYPPLRIKGKQMLGGHIDVKGNVSSQYISALLMIGPVLKNGLEMRLVGEIVSRPYIDLTLCIMKEFGADVEWTDIDTITVQPTPYVDRSFSIESDWSAASYWYEILALMGDDDSILKLNGLMDGSKQGDTCVRYLFSLINVKTSFEKGQYNIPTTVTLKHHIRTLPRLDYNFINSPDLAQTLVVCCALKGIPFHFTGLASLKIKETNRLEALVKEMRKLGFVIKELNESELEWTGEKCEASLEPIETYNDHRMAMAFAPASIMFPGLRINNPEVVSKSYPRFWEDMRKAGFQLIVNN